MARTFATATEIIALIDRGDVAAELSKKLIETIQACQDAAGGKAKAKGSVTLVLNLAVQGSTIEFIADIKTKEPKAPKSPSTYFVTADGSISTEHPQQLSMLPQEVAARRAAE